MPTHISYMNKVSLQYVFGNEFVKLELHENSDPHTLQEYGFLPV